MAPENWTYGSPGPVRIHPRGKKSEMVLKYTKCRGKQKKTKGRRQKVTPKKENKWNRNKCIRSFFSSSCIDIAHRTEAARPLWRIGQIHSYGQELVAHVAMPKTVRQWPSWLALEIVSRDIKSSEKVLGSDRARKQHNYL